MQILNNTCIIKTIFTYFNHCNRKFKIKAIIPTIEGYSVTSFIIVKNNKIYKSKLIKKEDAKNEFNNAINNN